MNDFELSPQRFAELRRAQMLASKISLLLDAIRTESGELFDYPAIRAAALEKTGYCISRTRWALLKHGKVQVVPEEVLRALAAVFGVSPQYLLEEDGELPPPVKASLEDVRIRRRARVRDFAAKSLGPVDPEAFRAIAKILDEEAPGLTDRSE